MPTLVFKVKRLRRVLNSKGIPTDITSSTSIGKVFVNTDENSGALMLYDRDEVWRLFPEKEKKDAN